MKQVICKVCGQKMGFRMLKEDHYPEKHFKYLQEVKKWLEEQKEKIRSFEEVVENQEN